MTESADFDLASLDAQDEMTLDIIDPRSGKPTGWVWTFYGPGHTKTVELSDRISRRILSQAREKERARVNNKKWKGDDQTPDEVRGELIDVLVGRTKGFTPVKLNGELIEYSEAAARRILLDPRKGPVLNQISEFLRDDDSFLQRSAKS
ncbi:branched-chain amino acid ABC transporter [Bradyrhizobium sp. AUGA SZCCT0158]|uniref:branched-chain amino acid ABC transporter n=1 Tax=Bradyrhizobium sp. AUGA SZCCT0158 TaxID=2807661 RepID=UPI001BA6FFD1|nr:branched-chain amino acid ABC transporter [Bradyrhizobium sp. AUGA SZCCT0158]MBR1198825.1 branched-chain amino acid ABC transporter [Bradyrhizobium sp. AUGA SZCCT0158]